MLREVRKDPGTSVAPEHSDHLAAFMGRHAEVAGVQAPLVADCDLIELGLRLIRLPAVQAQERSIEFATRLSRRVATVLVEAGRSCSVQQLCP